MDITPKKQDGLQPVAFNHPCDPPSRVLYAGTVSLRPGCTCKCAPDNGGITLSPGFCATVFADKIGHARHMAVAPDGTVYVNTWSGRYYGYDRTPPGGFLSR